MHLRPAKDATTYSGPSSLTPHCTSCGHYLLPCTVTASGIHPHVTGVSESFIAHASAETVRQHNAR